MSASGADDGQRHQRELDAAQQATWPARCCCSSVPHQVVDHGRRTARPAPGRTCEPPLAVGAPAAPASGPSHSRSQRLELRGDLLGVRGTNSGRTGSPVRSVATTSSNARDVLADEHADAVARAPACARFLARGRRGGRSRIRRLPASLIAAALPSSRHDTSSVSPIETSATARKTTWMPTSLAESLRGCGMADWWSLDLAVFHYAGDCARSSPLRMPGRRCTARGTPRTPARRVNDAAGRTSLPSPRGTVSCRPSAGRRVGRRRRSRLPRHGRPAAPAAGAAACPRCRSA